MFVYEFMAGIAGKFTAEDEDEDGQEVAVTASQMNVAFDPHKHRRVPNPTSYSETMMHLLKGSIGAGILAMPEAFMRTGVILGVVAFAVIGIFAAYTIQLLISVQYKLCIRFRRGYVGYPKSMRMALELGPKFSKCFARPLYYFVDTVLIIWQLGLCCVYVVFVSANIKQVCDYYNFVMSQRLHMCYLLIPFILVSLVKDLKLMAPMSSLSNGVTVGGLILVFFYLVEDDLAWGEDKLKVGDIAEIPIFIGTSLFAIEAVGVVLALEYNMKDPERFVGLCGLFNVGMTIIIVLYVIVGLFGFLKYGDQIKSSITLNLPPAEKKAQAAKIMFSLAIFLSFPLQNFVAYEITWRRLSKRSLEGGKRFIADYALRIILVIIPWALAVAVPHLGPFISLFGAFCLSLLAVIFPGIMDVCYSYSEPNGYGLCRYKLLRDICIIFIGIFCLFSGVYSSVKEIIEDSE